MLSRIKFGGKIGRKSMMFIYHSKHKGNSTAYISNYQWWRNYKNRYKKTPIEEMIVRILSHETLHLVIASKIRHLRASHLLDRIAGVVSSQDHSGLQDPDKLWMPQEEHQTKIPSKNLAKIMGSGEK